MSDTEMFKVIERDGWSYIVSAEGHESGPWRYRWEAQEFADDLNARKKKG